MCTNVKNTKEPQKTMSDKKEKSNMHSDVIIENM